MERLGVALFSRLGVPLKRFGGVLLHADALFVHGPEGGLGLGITLLGGLEIEGGQLLWCERRVGVLRACRRQPESRHSVALFGGFLEPVAGFGVVFGNSPALGIHQPQIILRHRVALLCRLIKPFGGFRIVARHSVALGIAGSQIILGASLTVLGCGPIPLERFRHIDPAPLAGRVVVSQSGLGGNVSGFGVRLQGIEFKAGNGWRRWRRVHGHRIRLRLCPILLGRDQVGRSMSCRQDRMRPVGGCRIGRILRSLLAWTTSGSDDQNQNPTTARLERNLSVWNYQELFPHLDS